MAQWVYICLQWRRYRFNPWFRKIPLEEGMAIHSSILDWRIPWTEEPGRLQPIGSQMKGLSTTNITGTNRHIQQEYYQLKYMGEKSSTDLNMIDNSYQVQHLAYVTPFKGWLRTFPLNMAPIVIQTTHHAFDTTTHLMVLLAMEILFGAIFGHRMVISL